MIMCINYLGCEICSWKPVNDLALLNCLPIYGLTPHCPQEVNLNITQKSSC